MLVSEKMRRKPGCPEKNQRRQPATNLFCKNHGIQRVKFGTDMGGGKVDYPCPPLLLYFDPKGWHLVIILRAAFFHFQ